MKNNLGEQVPERRKSGRSSAAEDLLLGSDRPAWAWEFLRRNPSYREAAQCAPVVKTHKVGNITVVETAECVPEIRTFGMCFAENPDRSYLEGAVFWQSDADDSIVRVSAPLRPPPSGSSLVDFKRLNAEVMVLKLDNGCEHVRVAFGAHSFALEVKEGSVLGPPVYLKCYVDLGSAHAQLQTLHRLFAIWRQEQFRKKDIRLDQRRFRWLLALHALDLEKAGLSQREIADRLIDEAVGLKWREKGDALRSRVRRIITLGRDLRDGGYLQLLSGREPETRDEALLH